MNPVLVAYAAKRNRTSRKVQYERIRRACPHNAGEGLTVIFDAMPLKGWHIVLLELFEDDDRRSSPRPGAMSANTRQNRRKNPKRKISFNSP